MQEYLLNRGNKYPFSTQKVDGSGCCWKLWSLTSPNPPGCLPQTIHLRHVSLALSQLNPSLGEMSHELYSLVTSTLSRPETTPDSKPLSWRAHLHGHIYFELSSDVIMPSWASGVVLQQELAFFPKNCPVFKYAYNKLRGVRLQKSEPALTKSDWTKFSFSPLEFYFSAADACRAPTFACLKWTFRYTSTAQNHSLLCLSPL